MKFGETLIKNGVITSDVLEEALQTQRFRKIRLGRLLRDLGHLSQSELNRNLILHLRPRLVDSMNVVMEKFKKISFSNPLLDWANRQGVVPYESSPTHLSFISSSFRDEVLEKAEKEIGLICRLTLVDLDAFNFLRTTLLGKELSQISSLLLVAKHTDDQKIAALDPYTSLFRDTILAAQRLGASDIHIQPTRNGVDIRFRIHGDLNTWKTLGIDHRQSFINELKRLTNLSIAVSGKAQDGRVSFNNWKLDIRASLLPSQYGEKIVLRLLDLTRNFDVGLMGFDGVTLGDLKTALKSKNGMVIISGPTGSGKTSTLYTLLNSIDKNTRNIVTLEDPIEYGVDGVTQVQVNSKLGFAEALRATLRQDPDVILVGEVRDSETADLCTKAAMTGHLVLSTLHANGAAEVVTRLINLGVDPFVLKSCLRFSAAQRLVKQLCQNCARILTKPEFEEVVSQLLKREISFDSKAQWKVRTIQGCGKCKSGVVGRLPVLEYMRNHEIQDYLAQGDANQVRAPSSLVGAALKHAQRGAVDVFEALEID